MSPTLGCKNSALSIEAAIRKIDQVSTLPHIAMKVMEVANDPNSGAMDLKEVMEYDPALSTRVLRYVNSSKYGIRNSITSLAQAIAYLGVKQIRNMAITTSVSELFRDERQIGPYSRKQLWHHLVSVGVCARLLAMRRGVSNFEDCFLAGLLHDIGIVLEDQHLHQPFTDVIHSMEEKKTLCQWEREKLSFTHTELAYQVVRRWKFPESIAAAIRYHHQSDKYEGPSQSLVYCVEVANTLCTLKGISSVGKKLVQFNKKAFEELSLERNDIEVLVADFEEELQEYSTWFDF